jgi:hypothetical protein
MIEAIHEPRMSGTFQEREGHHMAEFAGCRLLRTRLP